MNLSAYTHDAILYTTQHLLSKAGDDPHSVAEVVEEVATLVSYQQSDLVKNHYINNLNKKHRAIFQKTTFKKLVLDKEMERMQEQQEGQQLEEGAPALPAGVDKDFYNEHGYYQLIDKYKTGYWIQQVGDGRVSHRQVGNFVIQPLFHKYAKEDNTRIIHINNGFVERTLEIPSKYLTSADLFTQACIEEGNFLWGASKGDHFRIIRPLLDRFPLCYELRTLGWQPEGFWAFSNKVIHEGSMLDFDNHGIVKVEGQAYLSPSASDMMEGVRGDDDIYENDRYLSHCSSPITFSEWAKLMVEVYPEQGRWGVAFALMTIFRDLVMKSTKVPMLYAYGPVQAGKSDYAESIQWLFFSGKSADGNLISAFNLNQGTDFAFFSRMERFRNCPNVLNEFDEHGIKDEWFRAIKSAYDGEGREKGRGGTQGKTKTQKIQCSIILAGQYLSTKDDNSVLSRCIPVKFKPVQNRPEKQVKQHRKLKELEADGLAGILVELLSHRSYVREKYGVAFSKLTKELQDELMADGFPVKARVLKNMAAPATIVQLLQERMKLPWEWADFRRMVKEMVRDISTLLDDTNALADFWDTVIYLIDVQQELREGRDYKIETVGSLRITSGEQEDEIKFTSPKKVLFLRTQNVHIAYYKAKGREGLNRQTLITYLKDHSSYVGLVKATPYSWYDQKEGEQKSLKTSSHCFLYDELGVDLTRERGQQPNSLHEGMGIPQPPDEPLPFGKG